VRRLLGSRSEHCHSRLRAHLRLQRLRGGRQRLPDLQRASGARDLRQGEVTFARFVKFLASVAVASTATRHDPNACSADSVGCSGIARTACLLFAEIIQGPGFDLLCLNDNVHINIRLCLSMFCVFDMWFGPAIVNACGVVSKPV
jgi:hypothetical protein